MKLTIKTLKQSTFTLDAEPSDTIGRLKEQIEAAKGQEFYAAGLKLIFSGKVLIDTQTVAEYGIKETDFIVVMQGKPIAAVQPQVAVAPTPVVNQVAPPPPVPVVAPAPAFPETTISQLTDMGFQRDQVLAALQAAFGNADVAVDYLMNGAIPVGGDFEGGDLGGEEDVSGDDQDDDDEDGDGGEYDLQGDSPLAFLLQNPQFTQLRALIQQQPELLPAILQQLSQSNPELVQLINDNQEDFQALLNSPIGGGQQQQQHQHGNNGDDDDEHGHQIQVTAEEQAAIERLIDLGFDRNIVIQAYFACDKNEEMAANYLLENAFD